VRLQGEEEPMLQRICTEQCGTIHLCLTPINLRRGRCRALGAAVQLHTGSISWGEQLRRK